MNRVRGFWLLLMLAPGSVLAEGAVKLLTCRTATVCDAAGNCEQSAGEVEFRMEPLELEAGGAGTYRIAYGATEHDMTALSEVGPFFWVSDQERHTLMASSNTEWLWHRLSIVPTPSAAIRFMQCAFQQ